MTAPRSRRSKPAWQSTWLWETLQKRAIARGNSHASEFMPSLTEWMRHLDGILAKGGTSPLDFTLHDADHALRVANRMEQLLTPTVRRNLSDYELALLLLAAYGHDIGMTPERGKVRDHHRHLFGHPTSLSAEEKQLYQTFLDEYPERPIILPLGSSPADLDLADELTAYYVRERHNDWSAEWLRENLKPANFGHLPDVVNLLVRLCSSHHWDFKRLRRDDFEPILTTGPQPQLVHLRFLACILRLADILENDPERTPHVLYEHRAIEDRKKSLLHWRKDRFLTIDIRKGQLHFQARPPDAHVHKAAVQLADWIDHELHGIASLGEGMPVHNPAGKTDILREWHLPAALTRDIRPADDSYEYIEGAFRPNTARLLQLLSNEQLYGSPLVAVRELLQNAFDAVREKIARLRLDSHDDDIADRKHEKTYGDREKVTLTLRPGENGGWLLVCEDSGVGLSKALITGHLLVSGNSRRHAILDLERRCTAAGFPLGRTGQFGIGVLSYFMLADQVELTTTRSQLCEDNDAPGWTFTTRGVGSFGELRQLRTAAGTRITCQLKPDQIPDPAKFATDLLDYLKETLIRIPCRFEFKTGGFTGSDVSWQRASGWVKTEEDWLALLRSSWKDPLDAFRDPENYITKERLKELSKEKKRYPSDLKRASETLHCKFKEIELPNGAGFARLVLAYFELERGRSLISNPEHGKDNHFLIKTVNLFGWEGIACDVNLPKERDLFGFEENAFNLGLVSSEIDLVTSDSAQLNVSRLRIITPNGTIEGWSKLLVEQAHHWIDEVLAGGRGDFYSEVNLFTLRRPLDFQENRGWHHFGENGVEFKPLARPFAHPLSETYGNELKTKSNEPVSVIQAGPVIYAYGSSTFSKLSSCKICAIEDPFDPLCSVPCLYWPSKNHTKDFSIQFPAEWRSIAFLKFHYSEFVANMDHCLIQLLGEGELDTLRKWEGRSIPWSILENATTPGESALAFCHSALACHNDLASRDEWNSYARERKGHLTKLWTEIAHAVKLPFEQLRLMIAGNGSVSCLGPNEFEHSDAEMGDILVFPKVIDPNFLLFETVGRQ